jgi:DNA-binding transcriptional ArsR family regulator
MNRQDEAGRPGYAEHCVMRWSLDLVLRMIYETSVAFDGDLTAGIIFLALVRANTQHLSEPTQLEYSHTRGVIPDGARRPASVKSISDSLNLPYETVRRHLGKLKDAGYCDRQAGRGFIVPERVLMRPEFLAIIERNYASFQLMISRMQRGGLDVLQPLIRAAQPLRVETGATIHS